jgi:hypothetical protein
MSDKNFIEGRKKPMLSIVAQAKTGHTFAYMSYASKPITK